MQVLPQLPNNVGEYLGHLLVWAELHHLDRFLDHNDVTSRPVVDPSWSNDLLDAPIVAYVEFPIRLSNLAHATRPYPATCAGYRERVCADMCGFSCGRSDLES